MSLDMSLDKSQIKAQLVFSGCGGLYNYELGIASIIQEKYDLSNVVISSSSAGGFPALLITLEMNIMDLFENWNIPFLKDVNTYFFGAIGIWNNIVRKWTLPKLQKDAYIKAKNRLFCSLTEVSFTNKPHFTNHIITDWKSNEDLFDGIMASAFIPIFDIGKLTDIYRDKRYIDGGITNNNPIPYPELNLELELQVPTLIISSRMWKPINDGWFNSWYMFWCWSDESWARKYFEMGRKDTLDNLDKLDKILDRK